MSTPRWSAARQWPAARPWPLQAFAVDDTSVQLTWRGSPAAGLSIDVGDSVASPLPSPPAGLLLSVLSWRGAPDFAGGSEGAGRSGPWPRRPRLSGPRALDPAWPAGPGSAVVEGLAPGTTYDVVASAEGLPPFLAGRVTTLRPPEGRFLFKLAAVNDMHVGESHFGIWGRIWDLAGYEPGAEMYPVRALRAALAEAAEWGADLAVAKGDLTGRARPAELREVGCLLATSPVPVLVVLGNHDNAPTGDVRALLAKAGVAISWAPYAHDVPGLRLVLVNSVHAEPGKHGGYLPPPVSGQVASLAGEAATPAMVVLHHPPELHRYPTAYPAGIPLGESRALLDGLARSQPRTLLTSGHRHRNRRYSHGPVVIAETGSTKDYPGGWAGYKVYESGLVQVVRRTARPDVLAWTEATRRAVNGLWGLWSPGRLGDRCFAVTWV